MRHLSCTLAAACAAVLLTPALAPAQAPPASGAQSAAPPAARAPVLAQPPYVYPGIERGRFTLVGNDLTIQVETHIPGSVQILRGRGSLVSVVGRADAGLPGFSMSERGRARLHLGGIDAERLTYLVTVPERTRITVRLPDRELPESMRTLQRAATFTWEAPEEPEPPTDPPGDPPPEPASSSGGASSGR